MTRDEMIEKIAKGLCREKCACYGEPPCFTIVHADGVPADWPAPECDEPGCMAEAVAALTAIEAAGGWAPEGYAVVSVEPDEDCLERGADAYHHVWMMRKDEKITAGLLAGQPRPIFPNDWLRDVYRAMIAAAKE